MSRYEPESNWSPDNCIASYYASPWAPIIESQTCADYSIRSDKLVAFGMAAILSSHGSNVTVAVSCKAHYIHYQSVILYINDIIMIKFSLFCKFAFCFKPLLKAN